jgi:hypothetical protein
MVVGLHGANPQVGLRVHKVGFKGTDMDLLTSFTSTNYYSPTTTSFSSTMIKLLPYNGQTLEDLIYVPLKPTLCKTYLYVLLKPTPLQRTNLKRSFLEDEFFFFFFSDKP